VNLIIRAGGRSAIATLVERSTRYTMLVHLPGAAHDAETVRDGLVRTIQTLPAHLRGSLTWDQGSEMARHKQFSMVTDMPVYFCDPASPWQRGSNENTNRLLRQYFPKGTDLSLHSPEDLEHVAQELNGRPRKTLGWDTPPEAKRCCDDPLNPRSAGGASSGSRRQQITDGISLLVSVSLDLFGDFFQGIGSDYLFQAISHKFTGPRQACREIEFYDVLEEDAGILS
jgi:hypothetical protein